MKYTLEGRKTAVASSLYVRVMIILGVLSIGLLVYDIIEFGNLVSYVFLGIK